MANETGPLVQAQGLAYRYTDGRQALDGLSVTLEPGDWLHVDGPSGSGKSTLARCLAGLIPHLYRGSLLGRVCLAGVDTREAPLWQLTERAGLVFQNPSEQMFAPTVEEEILFGLENLGLAREEMASRLEQALDLFDLAPLRRRSPQTLSGGEQQKVALASVMARHPPLLVLDEPLSMLDSTSAMDLVEHLGHLAARGTAVVTCEHRGEYLRNGGLRRVLRLERRPVAALPPLAPPRSVPKPLKLTVERLEVEVDGRRILHRLSLAVSGGEVVALVGRNGSGKTTLLRAIAGLQRHEGRVLVNGARPRVGLVFQNADLQLFNGTVREEILYGTVHPDMHLYDWLLTALGLGDYEDRPPLLLSEGEKKRVALAAVLMHRPEQGILLDEPAVGQDSVYKAMLVRVARALAAAGQLVVIATHDLQLALQADRMIVLAAEGIVGDGAPVRMIQDASMWQRAGLRVPPWLLAQQAQVAGVAVPDTTGEGLG